MPDNIGSSRVRRAPALCGVGRRQLCRRCGSPLPSDLLPAAGLAVADEVVRTLPSNSCAHVYLVRTRDGAYKVHKSAICPGIRGDGAPKVASEIRYYKYITGNEPELSTYYPRLLQAQVHRDYAWLDLEYVEGISYYTSLSSSRDIPSVYAAALRSLLDKLSRWTQRRLGPVADPYRAYAQYYADRALAGITALGGAEDPEDKIRINGQELLSARFLLHEISQNRDLYGPLLPQVECPCFHGDLTLLNTVYRAESNEIRLVDPRGQISSWDPLYDLAKIRFTLGGFGELVLGTQPLVALEDGGYTIRFELLPKDASSLHSRLITMLAECEAFAVGIGRREPNWRLRLAMGEASHFLSDIAFYVHAEDCESDVIDLGVASTALGCYVLGTYYLNAVYRELTRKL